MRRLLELSLMLLLVGSNQVVAAPGDYGTLVRDLLKPKSERLALTTMIHSFGEAYSWANVRLLMQKQKRLYCPPETLSMNAENYVDILRVELRGNGKRLAQVEDKLGLGDMAALNLLDGLIATFPFK